MKLGQIIKELRKEKGLTQTELAELLHVSQDTISLWELNKSTPDAQTIVKICKLFKISADYFLGLDEN